MSTSTTLSGSPVQRLIEALDRRDEAEIIAAVDHLHTRIHVEIGRVGDPEWRYELLDLARALAKRLATVIRRRKCGAADFALNGCATCASPPQLSPECRRIAHLIFHLGSAGESVLGEFGLTPDDVRECFYTERRGSEEDGDAEWWLRN